MFNGLKEFKSSKASSIVLIAFVALFAFAAFGCVETQTQAPTATLAPTVAPTAAPSPSPSLIGGETDEHGCLVAAGYSWCEEKQKCLRSWEENCTTEQPSPEASIEPSLEPSPAAAAPDISVLAGEVAAAATEVLGVKVVLPQSNDRQWVTMDYTPKFYYEITVEKPIFNAFNSPSNVANLTGLNSSRVKAVETISTNTPSKYGFRIAQFCWNKAFLVTTNVEEQIISGGEPHADYATLLARKIIDICPE